MKSLATTLIGLSLAGLTLNAYALCVKPDGSLDDPSMSPGSIAMDMVPSCDAATAAGGSKQPAAATSNDKSDQTASVRPNRSVIPQQNKDN